MKIRLILADDHKMFRDGLRPLLERRPDLSVVGEAADGRELLVLVESLRPHLVVLDVSMPGLNGIEAARRIRDIDPSIRIAMLSMHADRRFVLEALKAGATAYLLKDDAFEELVRAIPRIMAGQVVLAESIGEQVVQEYITMVRREESSAFGHLTPREREVLQLIAEGLSTKEIAALQKVSVKTIETQRKQVMDKLNLHSVAELTKYAIREGLTSLD
ncbi:MAG: response regulator transcription factor [Candidatus Eisenbacteria bacterium]|uniref:Response regulator transcription factor n=1 Tax=Eiseniibacteriota bacterium TaxID=2212470 RepID=A0A948RTT4_UNCEI|nr:response regulator transcription factor [Candidatus Eisenbacteria bacterium]MBU1949970.1 response regulator transcription factor [Candidatus Eisenbacteria bacterium]MBU2689327.1 response regulator transcription factor [Candidatus Eisenbacteria bacterium]